MTIPCYNLSTQRVLGTVLGDTSPNHNSNSYNIETLHSTIYLLWTLWARESLPKPYTTLHQPQPKPL